MEREAYLEMFGNEGRHWWFVARRKIIQKILSAFLSDRARSLLEIGCGTGGNLKLLSGYGNIYGMELDDEALRMANSREICQVRKGALPDNIPFGQSFDVICLFDVLEHIDDDLTALQAIKKKLRINGEILITVPAYGYLWSAHDVANHHKRRYSRGQLLDIVQKAGFRIIYSTYCNTFLFPVIAVTRIFNNLFGREGGTDVTMPPKVINNLLMKIFASERFFMPRISWPFGVSILLMAENSKPCQGDGNKP